MVNIKKRNLKARQGTQRWRRNIVVELDQFDQIDFTQNAAKQVNFEIDSKPINIYENKDRFKKKPIDPKKLSKTERIKIQNLVEAKREEQQKTESDVKDIWGEEGGKRRTSVSQVKAVVTPHPGQSYNPQLKDYNELLDDVVKKEIRSHQRLQNEETEETKTQKQIQREQEKKEKKKLSRIQKIHGKEVVDAMIEKKKNHQLTLIKKIKKQINDDALQKIKKRQSIKTEKKIIERAKRLQGKNLVPVKVGNKKQK